MQFDSVISILHILASALAVEFETNYNVEAEMHLLTCYTIKIKIKILKHYYFAYPSLTYHFSYCCPHSYSKVIFLVELGLRHSYCGFRGRRVLPCYWRAQYLHSSAATAHLLPSKARSSSTITLTLTKIFYLGL